MGAKTGLTVAEYLQTAFPDLDKEYWDGELQERGMPNYLHGLTQALLVAFFVALRKSFPVFPTVETRVQLASGRFLIPDVAVFFGNRPASIPTVPPLIAIEVLSPDDRLSAVLGKLEEYRVWGVAHVWVVDPESRKLYVYDSGLRDVGSLPVPQLGIEIVPSDVFE
jgi:Uma2 family endonuclease